MLIVCPSCATAYNVEAESLRPEGRQVRCFRCRAVWQADLSHADKLLAAAEAIGPAREAPAPASVRFAAAPESQLAAEPAAAMAEESDAGAASPPDDAPLFDGQADVAPAQDDFAAAMAEESDTGAASPPGDAPSFDAQADVAPGQDDSVPAPVEDPAAAGPPAEVADVEAPPIAPVDLDEGRPPIDIEADRGTEHAAAPLQDIESVAARRQARSRRRQATRWPLSRLQTAILTLLFVDTWLLGWRSDFVRALPQTASLYTAMGLPVNLRGLAFEGVTTAAEQHEGVPILVVEGNVVNDAHKTVEMPRLKFIIRNAARQEIYSWTAVPSRAALPPGEAVAFHTRLASPPPEARDVLVRFVTRRDIIGGLH